MDNTKTNKSEEPAKQHYVPKVYLKNFCNSAGKLQAYDTTTKRTLSNMGLTAVAYQTHLYTIADNKGEKDYRVEKYLGQLESEYGEILHKIETTESIALTEKEITDVLWFIAFLYARNPNQISRYSEVTGDMLSFIGKSMLAHNLREQNKSHLRSSFEVAVDPVYVQTATMRTMFTFANTIFTAMINQGHWFFCRSQSDMEFITTDDPAANMVMVPLSKRLLLMRVTENIEEVKKCNNVLIAPPEKVVWFNGLIAATAKRFVFAGKREILAQAIMQIDGQSENTPDWRVAPHYTS